MPEYDLLIRNGVIVDGLQHPKFRGDIAIKDGRIAAISMGTLRGTGRREIDASGLVVAPGFIDIHTHYDAALSGWDPYATISGWHGVTTVSIGNCGFGFSPVRPEDQQRAMLRMERTESIPLAVMEDSMRWDWATFPEFMDSLQRHGLGVNVASLVPYSPLRSWVLGYEAARDPDYVVSEDEIRAMTYLLREGMEAGAFGFSFTFVTANRDFDGGWLPTHVVDREEMLTMASTLAEYNRGSIECGLGVNLKGLGLEFFAELAQVSGRPLNWNDIFYDPNHPDEWRRMLDWTESVYQDAVIHPINVCVPVDYEFDFDTIGLFDSLPAWNEATVGSHEERLAKLGDPARRLNLKADLDSRVNQDSDTNLQANEEPVGPGHTREGETGTITMLNWGQMWIAHVKLEQNAHLEGMLVADYASASRKHPVDAVLDLAVEEGLGTEFSMKDTTNDNEDAIAEIIKHPLTIVGSSDGGAHTKFLTTACYPTYFLAHWIRDKHLMSIEEAHWRLSTMPGWALGIRDRGWIAEGMPADIVVYDLDNLSVLPMEKVHDLPKGDWRWVQRSKGYRYTIVNGEVTFEDGICTQALPGHVLRSN